MQRLLLVFWKVTVPEGGGGGPAFTVSVAAVVVAVPTELVNTARYWFPFCDEAVVKVAVWPAFTVWFVGCVVIVGGVGEFTVSVAAVVVAVPTELVNTAR